MKTVLLVAPYFPPLARVGALRPLKLVRHLGGFGWRAVVLCLPSGGGVVDPRLAAAVPPEVVVDRSYAAGPLWWIESRATTRSVEDASPGGAARGSLERLGDRIRHRVDDWTFVDGRLPHAPHAVARAVRLARRHGADVIMATGDPWSGFVAAAAAARIADLPLVLDLRDPWTLEPQRFASKSPLIKALERRVERAVFERASRVVLNTRAARDAYRRAYPNLGPSLFTFQRNGFDRDLFDDPPPARPGGGDRFDIVYFGRFRRFRTMDPVQNLIEALAREHPELGRRARLRVVGGVEGEDRDRLAEAGGPVDVVPQVPYHRSLDVLCTADLLLLTLAGDAGLQVPAKLYDYLAAGRPVLALARSEEIASILAETRAGLCVAPTDASAAARFVADVASGRFAPPSDPGLVEDFSAASMARKIASILSGV